MKYFEGWTEPGVMMMSYDKFTMYLATIPDYSTDEESDDKDKKPNNEPTGSFNLFDFDQRQQ
jgi:hypothetical protein